MADGGGHVSGWPPHARPSAGPALLRPGVAPRPGGVESGLVPCWQSVSLVVLLCVLVWP